MKIFTIEKNEWSSFYTIAPTKIFDIFDNGELLSYTSSYHVIAARLLGFSYPDYLRYCRSNGAQLKGREGYTFPQWIEKADAQKICDRLNLEWEKLIKNTNLKGN